MELLATRENLPNGTVLKCNMGIRTVRWEGNKCKLYSEGGASVNQRPEGESFGDYGMTKYTVVSRPTPPLTALPKPGDLLARWTNSERKGAAMSRGLLAYFPDALAMVARHSVRSNEKHNPGQPVHWARGKSTDHEDCIIRHSTAIAADPLAMDDGQYEIVCRAWRALAALQVWIEEQTAKGVKL